MKRLVIFTAKWCKPCHRQPFTRLIDDLKRTTIQVDFVDADDEVHGLAADYDVLGLPTVIMLVDGVEVDRVTGAGQAAISKIREFAR